MLLKNEFEVDAGVDEAWAFFTDLARVMPCLPGAALEGVDGDTYLGNVKVKVGPIGAHFRGSAKFAEKDNAAHSAVISASGKDPKGQASANAQIHARLEPLTATRTRVLIDTDLDITGRMAQFGRGAIADVSNRLLGQFVANISTVIGGGTGARAETGAAGTGAAPPGAASTAPPAFGAAPGTASPAPTGADGEASMDALSFVLPMLKERYGQAIMGGLIGFLLSWLVFGRKAGRLGSPPAGGYLPPPWYVPGRADDGR